MAGLVFVPVSAGVLAAWAGCGSLAGPRRGFAVTPSMLAAFGLAEGEDAEYTVLCIAGIAGLLAHGERLVAVAEAPTTPGDDEFGEVVSGYDVVQKLEGVATDGNDRPVETQKIIKATVA